MQLIKFIVYANLIVSLAVGVTTAGVSHYLKHDLSVYYGACAFFATLFIYNLQRIMRFEDVKQQSSDRHLWLTRNKKAILVLTVLGAAGAMICYVLIGVVSDFPLVAFLLLIGVLYAYKGKRFKALRELPFLKIYLIAFVWTCVIVVWPSYREGTLEMQSYYIASSTFLYVFSATIPFDIRDLIYDTEQQKTIPQLIGEGKSKLLAVMLLVISGVLIQFFNVQLFSNPLFYVAYLGMALLILLTHEERNELYFSGLIDGWIVFFGLMFLIQN